MLQQSKKISKNKTSPDKKIMQKDFSQVIYDMEVVLVENEYDFDELAIYFPELEKYVFINQEGCSAIEWKDPIALKTLTQAILYVKFNVKFWDLPQKSLCPTIPSRLNYLEWIQKHFVQNIQKTNNLKSTQIKGIDIGIGANLIYPLLGNAKYGWQFLGTDIEQESIQNSQKIIDGNPHMNEQIQIIHNTNKNDKDNYTIFQNIIPLDQQYTFTMCNPPFFGQKSERKVVESKGTNMTDNEYIVEGGEIQFIKQMFEESKLYKDKIIVFTSLVGVKQHFDQIVRYFRSKKSEMYEFYTVRFLQGKNARWGIAWTFQKQFNFHKSQENIKQDKP